MKRLCIFMITACATTPPQPVLAQQNYEDSVGADRFKQRYGKLLVDSQEAPDWMVRGAGCSLGQMTAMANGQATVVPAHLCVAIKSAPKVTNATCQSAETAAWASLAQLFGVQNKAVQRRGNALSVDGKLLTVQGARLDATWRGSFNGASVCALQLVWPVAEFDALKASWIERGNEAQRLYDQALVKTRATAERCEDLKKSSELLAAIPGNRKLDGTVTNSNLLDQMVRQARGQYCVSEKTLILGLSCTVEDAVKPCNKRLVSGVVNAINKAGWKIVGSRLSDQAVARLVQGDQNMLRQQTSENGARYMGLVQVAVNKVGQRGRIMFCRASMDARLLDGRTGSASKTFEFSAKKGGLGLKQCVSNTAVWLTKKASKPMIKALAD